LPDKTPFPDQKRHIPTQLNRISTPRLAFRLASDERREHHDGVMVRRRVSLILLGVLALVGLMVVVFSPPPEPSHGGRKLSEWLDFAPRPYIPSNPDVIQAAKAIHNMGTNAVPWLVKWIRYEPPAWKVAAYQLIGRMVKKSPADLLRDDRQTLRGTACVFGFSAIGSEAKTAISDLGQIMNDPKRGQSAINAALTLRALGTEAIPTFLSGATSKNRVVRFIVSDHCRVLRYDTDPEVSSAAKGVLRMLDPQALRTTGVVHESH